MGFAKPLENLINQLLILPTVGPKTAQRLALYILKLPDEEVKQLALAIIEAKKRIYPCSNCGNLTDCDPCVICQDPDRDDTILCVVEEANDIIAIERTGYKGRYYVLNRNFSIMDNNGLNDLKIDPLIEKLKNGEIKEIILALNPDIDGEVVSRFIAEEALKFAVRITKLARGLPVGGDIEFADEITLRQAIQGRKEL